ncbi:MAG: hypothetical protein U0P45_01990 [Acidimicrobiales bacterium]
MARDRDASLRFPLTFYGATVAVLLIIQHISNRVLRYDGPYPLQWKGLRFYLDGWSQFDGPEYQKIAQHGYSYTPGQRSNIVWFPLYPNLLRWTHHLVVHDYLLAGILVSLVAGAAAVCLYWRWLDQRGIHGTARVLAFLVGCLYPYGWYLYGVVHSDSLFLALAVGAFLLVERRHLVWAGVVGGLATATRPTGMALIPALVAFGFIRDGVLSVPDGQRGLAARFALPTRFDRTKLRAATFGPMLVVGGVLAWMAYLGVRWGDPLAFKTNQTVYHPGDLPLLKRAFVVHWLHFGDQPSITLTTTGQALVALVVVLCIPAVCRRFGFAYGLYLAVLVAIPTVSTEDFMGTGRYMIAAFPAWAYLGERLAERSPALQRGVVAALACTVAFLAFGFSRSWYLT